MIDRICSLLHIKKPSPNTGLLDTSGATVPTDGTSGYQTGCVFRHTDGGLNTAVYVNEGSVTSCAFKTLTQTGVYSSTAGNGVTVSSANARPVTYCFDDNGVALSGEVRAVLSRVLLTVAPTGTINALRGQLKMLDTIGTAAGSVVSPIRGYIECSGTGSRSIDGHVACMRAALEEGASGTTTIASGAFLAGLECTLNSSRTYTVTGSMAGIIVNTSGGTSLWPVGILVQNSVSPVVIGAAVADTAVEVGSFSPPGTNFIGLQMNFQNAGTSLGRLTGMQIDVDDTSTHTNTIACARFYSQKVSGTGGHEHWGIMAQTTVTAGKVANTVAGMFTAIVKDGAVVGTNGGGHRAFAVAADVDFSGTGDYADTPDMITGAIIGTLLGHAGNGVTSKQKVTGIICAQMGGDTQTVTAGAYFKCLRKNSISASKADYGLDMYHDESGAYKAIEFAVADIRLAAGMVIQGRDTAISDGDGTSLVKGSIVTTSHSTGGGSLFVSDGSNLQEISID